MRHPRANLVTHPIVWHIARPGHLLILAALLYAFLRRDAALLLALSLTANAASCSPAC